MKRHKTVHELHTESMNLIQEGIVAYYEGDVQTALDKYKEALPLEKECVKQVENIDNNEPMYTILKNSRDSIQEMIESFEKELSGEQT